MSPDVTLCPCALTHAAMAFLACKSPHLDRCPELPPSVCACVCVLRVWLRSDGAARSMWCAASALGHADLCSDVHLPALLSAARVKRARPPARQVLVKCWLKSKKKKFRHKPNQICKTIWFHTILLQRLTSSTPAPTCGSPSLAALRGSRAATSGSPVLRCAL